MKQAPVNIKNKRATFDYELIALLCRRPRVAVDGARRAGGRVSAAPSLRHRHLHPALSHTGARHAEQCAQPHRAGHAQDA